MEQYHCLPYITYISLSLHPVLRQTDVWDVMLGLRCMLVD